MKRICLVTGSRAEWGLLSGLAKLIRGSERFELKIVVTGSHLGTQYGGTISELEQDGFKADHCVDMLLASDTALATSKSIGIGVLGLAQVFEDLRPDLLVLLGDRFEIFAAAIAALPLRIPVAHIHGGETSFGAIDESMRHCISKLSHLHFTAAKQYANRVIQLGENPLNVFVVGALGIDNIKETQLYDLEAVETNLKCKLKKKAFLVTYHPETTKDQIENEVNFDALLKSLAQLNDTSIIFTFPNSDHGSEKLRQMAEEFCLYNVDAKIFPSLGARLYLSLAKLVDAVVGNSSSGLIEIPSLGVGTINIGSRQDGRLRAPSVIDCQPNTTEIAQALKTVTSDSFKRSITDCDNPNGSGNAAIKILEILKEIDLTSICEKSFHDLESKI